MVPHRVAAGIDQLRLGWALTEGAAPLTREIPRAAALATVRRQPLRQLPTVVWSRPITER